MPFTICKEFTFAAAHFIAGHPGKCRNMHGHNYRTRVIVAADELDELGMVVDFAKLKRLIQDVMGRFDHGVINEMAPFDRLPSSAENLAKYGFEGIAAGFASDERVRVVRVEIWESNRSYAAYEP